MPGRDKLKEKLTLYLSTLSDSAQALLMRTLEQAVASGANDSASDLILDALRAVLKDKQPQDPFETHVRRELFRPAEPFTSKLDLKTKVEGRISPSSHDAIWKWIKRDIANEEQKAQLEESCDSSDAEATKKKALKFCADLSRAIHGHVNKTLKELGGDQKLSGQLGGHMFFEDLKDILVCPERVQVLKPILTSLPEEICTWDDADGEAAYNNINRYLQQAPLKASWLFSAITPKLRSSRLKIQLATRLAGSDDAIQVAATVYAPAVTQTLAEMEAHLASFEKCIHSPAHLEDSINSLTDWRKLAKAVEAELEIAVQCPWGKSMVKMKADLSAILEREIDPTPGLIRQALRAPKNGMPESADENLLQDATRATELFHHAERMKDSLALNETVSRIRKDLDHTFEILTTSIIERTRKAQGKDIETCNALGEAAAVFAKHLFDEDYASAFRRQLRAASFAQDLAVEEAS